MDIHENISNAYRSLLIIAIVALLSISIVSSVALITMSKQSCETSKEQTEWFRLYMEADYDYGTITQSQDVQIGD